MKYGMLISFVAIAALLLFNSCSNNTQNELNGDMKNEKLNNISRIIKDIDLALPKSSKVIEFYEKDTFVDPIWVAKIELPEKDMGSIEKNIVSKPTDKSTVHGGLADTVEWWTPADIVLNKQYLADQNTFVRLILAQENGKIYLFVECIVF